MLELITLIIFSGLLIYSLIKQYIIEKKGKENNSRIDNFCEKHYKKIWIIFIAILFITVIYKFGDIPTYIGVDEAGMIYDAYCLSEYGTDRYMNSFPLYLRNYGSGQSALCAYLVAVCIKLFGYNMISFRLPTLLIYLISVIVSYLLISKSKNKKTALLFTFIIITCPWNIFNARMALDCNLYAGLFMLDLYLMDKAKKNYQYFIAGISIGITLYTYCLSWISMPLFLLLWTIYMLYIKKVKFYQIIILGIPIVILALPLIYFLLLNYGIVNQSQIGIFTLPILSEFRGEQINITNIFKTGLESIQTIFFNSDTIYLIYVPLFVLGYILEFRNSINEIKNKKYGITTLMVIAFTTLCLGLLTTRIPTPNKANVLFIPILYFVTIAILEIGKNSRIILVIEILTIVLLTIKYEYNYYTDIGITIQNYYQDKYLYEITKELESNEETKNMKKVVLAYTSGPHIYNLLALKLSPQEYVEKTEVQKFDEGYELVRKVKDYYYLYSEEEMNEIDLSKEEYIFILTNNYTSAIEYLKNNDYQIKEYGYYMILIKK